MAYHPRGSWNSFASEAENNKHGVNINVYNFQVLYLVYTSKKLYVYVVKLGKVFA